ncbi:hypothetical protein [Ramlibacter rhizophilus]|uniref:Uncharacterized protein n=1 Tax=Ramlibacter rhizophilus TaxID=1781167 RepID=A0A4Z0BRU7_9BURK|nr:hypothetical protein [Ramlibacter rhizophilus]TFZ01174.1 hypothetical protein EZ242_07235 [Ramlibacter rhizophilus]
MLKFLRRGSLDSQFPPPPPAAEPACPRPGELLSDVFEPPVVVHGDGGDADWALWDECMSAWDSLRPSPDPA